MLKLIPKALNGMPAWFKPPIQEVDNTGGLGQGLVNKLQMELKATIEEVRLEPTGWLERYLAEQQRQPNIKQSSIGINTRPVPKNQEEAESYERARQWRVEQQRRLEEDTKVAQRADQAAESVASMLPYSIPYLGQALAVKDMSDALYEGNNEEAALMAGLLFTPFALKGGKKVLNSLKNTNLGRALKLSRELNKGIRNATRYGDIRVSESALQDPTKFYRFVEQPEVGTIEELGFNVTSGDAKTLSSAANRYRVNNLTHYNKTKTEGKRPGLLTKASSSHGNTSQASVGKLWNGSINQSNNLFRRGVLEGDLYEGILASNGNRSAFNPTSLSDLSLGLRIGFRTGTMPTENLRYFEDLGNGMYRYNGQVLPEQRIYQIGNQEYIPTLNIQDVLNTKISLNHVLPELYVIPNFTSKHGSLAMPSTADTPVGWGNSPVLFLKNSAISKYPHQAYIGDGQVNTVNGVFGRNKDFSNYSLSELRDALNSKMDKVKGVYLPEKSTPTTDENMIFNSKLRRYLSERNPDAYIGPSYDELHFHSAIPLEDFKYAFFPDYETAPELLPLFDKYGIKTNFDFSDKRGVDLEAFRNWITNNDKDIGFRKVAN